MILLCVAAAVLFFIVLVAFGPAAAGVVIFVGLGILFHKVLWLLPAWLFWTAMIGAAVTIFIQTRKEA